MRVGDLVKVKETEWVEHNPWMNFPDEIGLVVKELKACTGEVTMVVVLFPDREETLGIKLVEKI